MTTKLPEPAEEPVRIKLSGDMQKNGDDAVLIGGTPDLVIGDVAAKARKDSTNGR